MRFYNRQHRHYCGIDLHVKTMYLCILDAAGQVLVHRNVPSTPEAFLETIAPYRDDLVVAAECMFTWYWLADLCAAEGIVFVLGHALAMKAIHGGKAKNDRIDSHKIVSLLRGGLLPHPRELSWRISGSCRRNTPVGPMSDAAASRRRAIRMCDACSRKPRGRIKGFRGSDASMRTGKKRCQRSCVTSRGRPNSG